MSDNRKEITLPLKDYLETLWGPTKQFAALKAIEALEISKIDFDEQYCHVQWLEIDDKRKERIGLVWRKSDWLTDVVKQLEDKEKSEIRIAKWNKRKELVELICSGIRAKLGIDGNNLAELMIKEDNIAGIEMMSGVKITVEQLKEMKI